jgi:predicted ABC-type ATPase
MPVFTIVAGPNGAGKSSYSDIYAHGASIHDADKHKVALQMLHPGLEISDEYLYDHLAECYQNFEKHGLLHRQDMLVETNLREEYLIERALHMRSVGYQVNMLFVALESIEKSKERVDQRIAGKGHRVGVLAITENFEKGLINLKKHIRVFDNFMLVTPDLLQVGSSILPPQIVLRIKAGKVTYFKPFREAWANQLAQELIICASSE